MPTGGTAAQTAPSKHTKLEPFNGKNTIEAKIWLNLFEVVCRKENASTDEEKTTELMSYLKDDALSFYGTSIATRIPTITWSEVRQLIEKRFGTPETSSIVEANHRRLRRNETIKEYFDDKMRHLDKTSNTVQEKCDMLTDGVSTNEQLQTNLLMASITTTEDWLQKALKMETALNRRSNYSKPFNKDFKPHNQSQSNHKSFQLDSNPDSECFLSDANHAPYPCRYCQYQGREEYHWHSECPIKANLAQSRGNRRPGHRQNNNRAPVPPNTVPRTNATDQSSQTNSDGSCDTLIPCKPAQMITSATQTSQGYTDHFLHIDVKLDDIPLKAYVDSGSTISVASEQTLQRLNKQLTPNSAIHVRQVSGKTKTVGCFQGQLKIATKVQTINFHVIPNFKYPLLLGLDAGQQFGLQLDLNTCKVSLASNPTDNECSQPNAQHEANTGPTMATTQSTSTVPHTTNQMRSRPPEPQQQTQQPILTTQASQTVCHQLRIDGKLNNCPPEAKQVEARNRQSSDDRPPPILSTQPKTRSHRKKRHKRHHKYKPLNHSHSDSLSIANVDKGPGHSKSHQNPEHSTREVKSDVTHSHSNTTGKFKPNIHSNYSLSDPPNIPKSIVLFPPNKTLNAGEM